MTIELDNGARNYEERIYKDTNGFYNAQCRILPLEPWESCDGWRSFYTTIDPERAKAKLLPEFQNTQIVYAKGMLK